MVNIQIIIYIFMSTIISLLRIVVIKNLKVKRTIKIDIIILPYKSWPIYLETPKPVNFTEGY